jgi:hypothetical protein
MKSETLVNCGTYCRYPVQANPLDDLRQGAELPDDSAPLQQRHPHVERLQCPHGNDVHIDKIIKKRMKRDDVTEHMNSNHMSFSFMYVKNAVTNRNIN